MMNTETAMAVVDIILGAPRSLTQHHQQQKQQQRRRRRRRQQ